MLAVLIPARSHVVGGRAAAFLAQSFSTVVSPMEKRTDTYEAFLHLACALLCFHQCDRIKVAS